AAVDLHGNVSGYASLGLDIVAVSLGTPSVGLAFEAPTPQPARDVVRLRFAMPERAEARLAIFDVSGRLVADLADRTFEPGVHDLRWRAGAEGRIPGGVYFAKLTTLGRTFEQRVVVIH